MGNFISFGGNDLERLDPQWTCSASHGGCQRLPPKPSFAGNRGQLAVRRPTRPHSGPLRAFQAFGGTPGYPRNTRQRRFPAPLAPALTAAAPPATQPGRFAATTRATIDGRPPRPSSCCSAWTSATASFTAAGRVRGRSGSRGGRERRGGADPGAWPSPEPSFAGNRAQLAVRRPTRPHSGPLRAFLACGGTSGYP